jgi:hypothetical protein
MGLIQNIIIVNLIPQEHPIIMVGFCVTGLSIFPIQNVGAVNFHTTLTSRTFFSTSLKMHLSPSFTLFALRNFPHPNPKCPSPLDLMKNSTGHDCPPWFIRTTPQSDIRPMALRTPVGMYCNRYSYQIH